jgi:hypothetical protein
MPKDPFRKDPYVKLARRQYQDLQAGISGAQADLEAFRQSGDKQSARAALQQIADLTAQQRNLSVLHDQCVASKTVPQQPAQSTEQWQHKPPEAMNYDDALQVFKTSKYGKDLDWQNKDVQAGYQEAMRRRQRGE